MSIAAQTTQPSFHCRAPILPDLVIHDLNDMEGTGLYDRDVLLWLQDGYISRAIMEHLPQLRVLHASLVESGESPDEMLRHKTQALIAFTRATYADEKAAGRGADRVGYINAAQTFYETESVRYGEQLQEIPEYIQRALENGEQPDIERYGGLAYASMAKLSKAMDRLEALSGKPALQGASMMDRGIEGIRLVSLGDQFANVGRDLLRVVDRIQRNPGAYFNGHDLHAAEMPERGPLDFEPMQRQGEYSP